MSLPSPMTEQSTPTVLSSRAEVWYLKQINFGEAENRKDYKIITQNFNGPCSFIAICNILILRGNIDIQPPSRSTVSYEFLSQLVAEYLLSRSPDDDVSAALTIMPKTQVGMDLNPLFTDATAFRPAGDGGELKLFEHVGVQLVHGWLVDPTTLEGGFASVAEDYDSAVNLIVEADHIAKGELVVDERAAPQAGSSSQSTWTDAERSKVENAIVVRRFLDSTRSQLTYHGLFNLATSLEPDSLVALFRSSHLSVLYKAPGDEGALYTLVTDQSFLNEPDVVWEKLEDVDGEASTFVDSSFIRSSPAGGDFAGRTAEEEVRASERLANELLGEVNPADLALAQQLQAEEDMRAQQEYDAYLRQQQRRGSRPQSSQQSTNQTPDKPPKKKKDCIIM